MQAFKGDFSKKIKSFLEILAIFLRKPVNNTTTRKQKGLIWKN